MRTANLIAIILAAATFAFHAASAPGQVPDDVREAAGPAGAAAATDAADFPDAGPSASAADTNADAETPGAVADERSDGAHGSARVAVPRPAEEDDSPGGKLERATQVYEGLAGERGERNADLRRRAAEALKLLEQFAPPEPPTRPASADRLPAKAPAPAAGEAGAKSAPQASGKPTMTAPTNAAAPSSPRRPGAQPRPNPRPAAVKPAPGPRLRRTAKAPVPVADPDAGELVVTTSDADSASDSLSEPEGEGDADANSEPPAAPARTAKRFAPRPPAGVAKGRTPARPAPAGEESRQAFGGGDDEDGDGDGFEDHSFEPRTPNGRDTAHATRLRKLSRALRAKAAWVDAVAAGGPDRQRSMTAAEQALLDDLAWAVEPPAARRAATGSPRADADAE